MKFPTIPPKTLVTVSYLFVGIFTAEQIVSYVTSDDGNAKRIPVMLQRIWPKWWQRTLWVLVIAGLWVLINLIVSLIKFLWLYYH